MIKAEVIIHEGNPGPNWLDRCRAVITPGSMSVVVVVLAVAVLALTVVRHQDDTARNEANSKTLSHQEVTPSASLKVTPLQDSGSADQTMTGTVQSATGGASKTAPTQDTGSGDTGAPSTPTLNTTPANSSQGQGVKVNGNGSSDSSGNSSSLLNNTAQNLVKGTQDTVNNVVNGLTAGL